MLVHVLARGRLDLDTRLVGGGVRFHRRIDLCGPIAAHSKASDERDQEQKVSRLH